jgi:hypothetical protein
MNLQTNGDYNALQLNKTINYSPDGKVLSKSLMYNLRGEKLEEIWKNYQELEILISNGQNNPKKTEKPKIQENIKDCEEDKICPDCGAPLVEKSGISKKNKRPYHFWSCSNWPRCTFTKPYLEKESNEESIEFEY